ncbi:metal-dependent transcriptional regulator [candidate division KSB1 bacterium]
MSVPIENFLKAVYQKQYDDQEKAISSKLALELRVSNAAITDMAKKLHQSNLINYKKYNEIKLTEYGKKIALKVIRKHRLWELFLFKVLNLSERDIHIEAELLEHQTTDYLINRIDEYLGNPKFDPHGDPIPDINFNMPDMQDINPLIQCQENKTYKIARLIHRSGELSTFFRENNLKLEQELTIDKILAENQIVILKYQGKTLVLNDKHSRFIYVSEK